MLTLTISEAKILLKIIKIPFDIQNKILMLFIGLVGTPSSNAIKSQMICPNNKSLYNGSLVERIILENDTYTLWRINVICNKGKCFSFAKYVNLYALYTIFELQIAYLSVGILNVEKQLKIDSLKEAIISNKRIELFKMFYNMDKHNNYSQECDIPNYFGTPTSNIINNAIYCGIIKEIIKEIKSINY
jgi:hypothetical protein